MKRSVLNLLLIVSLSGTACYPFRADCDSSDPVCSPTALLLHLLGCSQRLLGGVIQGCPALSLTGTVSTLAGTGATGFQDGAGATAQFSSPEGVTTDGLNLYVVGSVNNKIRRINIATGIVSTVAGTGAAGLMNGAGTVAQFNGPKGITTDGTNLYVVDVNNHLIRQVAIATGEVSTFAGSSFGFQDGAGTVAQFNNPVGITTDGISLFVGDTSNNRIRKIDLVTKAVTTFAGDGTPGFLEGPGASAQFSAPREITTDGVSLFVADTSNGRIRQINLTTRVVSTIAGDGTTGFQDGPGVSARFDLPFGITTDGTALFVVDRSNHKIRRIQIDTGFVTTLAGDGGMGFQDGPGASAQFFFPFGATTDGVSLYIGDSANERVRKIQ